MQFERPNKAILPTEEWNPGSRIAQYKCMVGVLEKKLQYQKHEKRTLKRKLKRTAQNLRKEYRDGTAKLKLALYEDNAKKLKNLLINHKDMQRLYQRMPLHLVVDNIDQRTFVLRKERDRLSAKLQLLKDKYADKLIEKSKLEDRIKYQNEFVLDEETKIKECRKHIENSLTRLKGIKTINRVYQKMWETLRNDAIYYEPVLDSLARDLETQKTFTDQVIAMGLPVMENKLVIAEEFRKLEEAARKNAQMKNQWMAKHRKETLAKNEAIKKVVKKGAEVNVDQKRYARETSSMLDLKSQLENIEETIKQVKYATLSTKAKDIYPKMRKQLNDNARLRTEIGFRLEERDLTEVKEKLAYGMEESLKHDLTQAELDRLDQILILSKQIQEQKKIQQQCDEHMKNHSEIYVLIRYALWNISDVLRFVGRQVRAPPRKYPNPDLKLPLLKFEVMKSFPPDAFEENADTLLELALKRVRELMSVCRHDISPEEIEAFKNEYHQEFLKYSILDNDAEIR